MASCSHQPGTPRLQNSCLMLSASCAVTAETSPGLTTLPTDLGLRPHGHGHCMRKHVKTANPASHTYRPRAMESIQRSQNCDLGKQCPSSSLAAGFPEQHQDLPRRFSASVSTVSLPPSRGHPTKPHQQHGNSNRQTHLVPGCPHDPRLQRLHGQPANLGF